MSKRKPWKNKWHFLHNFMLAISLVCLFQAVVKTGEVAIICGIASFVTFLLWSIVYSHYRYPQDTPIILAMFATQAVAGKEAAYALNIAYHTDKMLRGEYDDVPEDGLGDDISDEPVNK
jgi:hypothetical protein